MHVIISYVDLRKSIYTFIQEIYTFSLHTRSIHTRSLYILFKVVEIKFFIYVLFFHLFSSFFLVLSYSFVVNVICWLLLPRYISQCIYRSFHRQNGTNGAAITASNARFKYPSYNYSRLHARQSIWMWPM